MTLCVCVSRWLASFAYRCPAVFHLLAHLSRRQPVPVRKAALRDSRHVLTRIFGNSFTPPLVRTPRDRSFFQLTRLAGRDAGKRPMLIRSTSRSSGKVFVSCWMPGPRSSGLHYLWACLNGLGAPDTLGAHASHGGVRCVHTRCNQIRLCFPSVGLGGAALERSVFMSVSMVGKVLASWPRIPRTMVSSSSRAAHGHQFPPQSHMLHGNRSWLTRPCERRNC